MAVDERSTLLVASKKRHPWLGTVFVARLVTFASSFSEGYELAIFSLILVPVTKEFDLTTNDLVLLASVPMAAGLIGYLGLGWCMDMVGRKPTLILSYVICFVGCSLMATAHSVAMLGVGRGIIALGIRSGVICVSVYMSELSPAGTRGTLVSVEEIYLNIGILAATFAAWGLMGMKIVTWRTFVSIGAFAPALALVCILCLQVPESPRYLQMWGRLSEATTVLRAALEGDEVEISRTLSSWGEEEADMQRKSWMDHLRDIRALPRHRGFRLATYCWMSRAGSGIVILSTYFSLFMKGMGQESTLRWFTIGQTAKTLTLLLPVCWLIDSCGRRALFLASAVACCSCTASAAVLQISGFPIVAVACCIVAYFMSFSIGYGPVVWVYCFEILPQQQRGRAATISMLCGDVFSGTLLIVGPYLLKVHAALPYVVISATNLIAALFFFSACPETAGMLLEDAGKAGMLPEDAGNMGGPAGRSLAGVSTKEKP